MSAAELDRMCAEAMQRIIKHINYCAGQQLRRMAESWAK